MDSSPGIEILTSILTDSKTVPCTNQFRVVQPRLIDPSPLACYNDEMWFESFDVGYKLRFTRTFNYVVNKAHIQAEFCGIQRGVSKIVYPSMILKYYKLLSCFTWRLEK